MKEEAEMVVTLPQSTKACQEHLHLGKGVGSSSLETPRGTLILDDGPLELCWNKCLLSADQFLTAVAAQGDRPRPFHGSTSYGHLPCLLFVHKHVLSSSVKSCLPPLPLHWFHALFEGVFEKPRFSCESHSLNYS